MSRIRMLIAAALLTLVVGAAAPAAQAGSRKKMVQAINGARASAGLRHLRFSRRLTAGATAWARHLMRAQILAHASHQQGEIIEWHSGAAARIRSTVVEWLNSDGHRRVMLGHYRKAGAGRAVGYFGGQRCTIWVVRFAR